MSSTSIAVRQWQMTYPECKHRLGCSKPQVRYYSFSENVAVNELLLPFSMLPISNLTSWWH